MLDYKELNTADGLEAWPPLSEQDCCELLDGDPQGKGRHDLGTFTSRLQVGVWECTPGKMVYTYPADEICTLLKGKLKITDATGNTREYSAGDTFFATKGESLTWEIVDTVRKVFMVCNADAED